MRFAPPPWLPIRWQELSPPCRLFSAPRPPTTLRRVLSPSIKKRWSAGRDRFNIYCSVCHDALGTGNGKIVERGYLPPPNYHLDYSRGFERRGQKVLLREVPIGYFYEVITRGFGGMPDYKSQIPRRSLEDRCLRSRLAKAVNGRQLKDLPADEREKIRAQLSQRERAKSEPRHHPGDQPGDTPRGEVTAGEWEGVRRTALLVAAGGACRVRPLGVASLADAPR